MTQSSNNIAGTATLPATWHRILAPHAARIAEVSDERHDGHGVWVYFQPGWVCFLGHQAHESSARAMRQALATLAPCSCEDCLRGRDRLADQQARVDARISEQDRLQQAAESLGVLEIVTVTDRADPATVKPLAPSPALADRVALARATSKRQDARASQAMQATEAGRMWSRELEIYLDRKREARQALREAVKAEHKARTRAQLAKQGEAGTGCDHKPCLQAWIDTGSEGCTQAQQTALDRIAAEDAARQAEARARALPVAIEAALLLNRCGDAAAPVSTGRASQACWAAVRELAALLPPADLNRAIYACSDPAEAMDVLRDLAPQD